MLTFKSKIDNWLKVVFVAAFVVDVVAMWFVIQAAPGIVGIIIIFLTIGIFGVFWFWFFLGTVYQVDSDTLLIKSGPFRWRVPRVAINSIRATRNPISSPALSLDRLEINYGSGKKIRVSPADKTGFLKALDKQLDT